ncbi:MAG: exodeoxyribonuclease VII large subunit [Anaerovoracaceae bacterium]
MAIKPLSVSQLNGYISRILQTDPILGNLLVTGEISNLKFHQSGHVYFSLKDEESKVNCFLHAATLEQMKYKLTEGLKVTVAAYVSVYEPGGYYSLNVKDIQASGMGELAIAFAQLKEKLEKEGLFDPSKKKKIPLFPKKIAVVTASTGAAIEDILQIITEKNHMVDILIYPVTVQGPKAPQEIADGITAINREFPQVDTIIVGRGGGSMEDLWAFNEEVVARSIAASTIPVISAVGHQIDFTISDFVADLRAETPTAAANLAVPDTSLLQDQLDYLGEELERRISLLLEKKRATLEQVNLSVFGNLILEKIQARQNTIDTISQNNHNCMLSLLEQKSHQVQLEKSKLENSAPQQIMKKGYGIVLGPDNRPITKIAQLEGNSPLTLVLSDGKAIIELKEVLK